LKKQNDLFESFGNVMGLSNFPGLNNGGELLSLENKYGALIHFVDYQDEWYDNDAKKSGGYSLEMIDISNPCGKNENWTGAKNNVYGTPGSENSQKGNNLDVDKPYAINAVAIDSVRLLLNFSETIDSGSLYNMSAYTFPNNTDFQVASLGENSGPYESLVLELNKELAKNLVYQLQISGLKDCAENLTSSQIIDFALPEKPLPLDLVINEVLFNPKKGGSDFVELYNRSSKYLDLADFLIASRNGDGELSSISALSNEGFLSIGESLKTGLAIAAIAGVIGSIFTYIFVTFIEPDFVVNMLEATRIKMIDQNPEMTEEQMKMALGMTEKMMSPGILVAIGMIASLFFGFIVSLIAGLIMKQNRPTNY